MCSKQVRQKILTVETILINISVTYVYVMHHIIEKFV